MANKFLEHEFDFTEAKNKLFETKNNFPQNGFDFPEAKNNFSETKNCFSKGKKRLSEGKNNFSRSENGFSGARSRFTECKFNTCPLNLDLVRLSQEAEARGISPIDLAFDFHFKNPGERLHIAIDEYQGDQKILLSTLTGGRAELTTSNLTRLTLAFPLVTLKIIFLIHWEALRLWLKGIPFRTKESHAEQQKGAFRVRK